MMVRCKKQGKLALFLGNDNAEPCVVYVLGINDFGLIAMQKINSGVVLMSDPEKGRLEDFDFNKYELLRAEWFINNAEQTKQRWIETKDELVSGLY